MHPRFTGMAWRQLALQLAFIRRQLLQQVRADGQAITAGQLFNLAEVTEARTHHYGFVAIGLVVVVDARYRHNAWVFSAGVVVAVSLLVPVVDTAHERRNQEHTGFGAGHGLSKRKQQRQVGLNAFFFQLLRCADAFPGGGDLDQHAVTAYASFVVQVDQTVRTLENRGFIERQTRIHLGGNTPRHDFENLLTYRHRKTVAGQADVTVAVLHSLIQQRGIAWNRRRLEQQGRVSGGVLRLELGEGGEIAGIGYNGGELLELFQLGSHGRALSCGSDDITRAPTSAQGRKYIQLFARATT